MPKNELLTLRRLGEATSPLSSTIALPFTLPGKGSNSFSMPAILYYLTKAKTLQKLGITDESEALDSHIDGYLEATRVKIKDTARDVYAKLQGNGGAKRDKSVRIQNVLLGKLLDETSSTVEGYSSGSIDINATAAKKNITIPCYLYERYCNMIGSKMATVAYINQTMRSITETLKDEGFMDTDGKTVIGPPSNSSWARKLHNKMIIKLVEMNLSQEVREGLLDIKMCRDVKLEILYQKRQLVE